VWLVRNPRDTRENGVWATRREEVRERKFEAFERQSPPFIPKKHRDGEESHKATAQRMGHPQGFFVRDVHRAFKIRALRADRFVCHGKYGR
jgi:hypothetical protein